MKPKKSIKANLEKKRTIFFQIGLIITLGIVLTAFEWSTKKIHSEGIDFNLLGSDESDYLPPNTEPLKPKPPEPKIITSTVLKLVDKDVDTPVNLISTEPIDSIPVVIAPVITKEPDDLTYEQFEVTILPEFPGGESAFNKYIAENTKYPQQLLEIGVTGKVYVSFVVDKDGSVTDVSIYRGEDAFLDKEALRVISSSPKWKPGFHNGGYVKVRYVVPIKFSIN
jgi:protein TonB